MKTTVIVKPHLVSPGENVVEVMWNGKLVCTITGADGPSPGVRIISKHTPVVKEPHGMVTEVNFIMGLPPQ